MLKGIVMKEQEFCTSLKTGKPDLSLSQCAGELGTKRKTAEVCTKYSGVQESFLGFNLRWQIDFPIGLGQNV